MELKIILFNKVKSLMASKQEKYWEKENLEKCFLLGNYILHFRHKDTGFIAAIKKIVKSKVK